MIRTFDEIYKLASGRPAAKLAIINPRKDYLFSAISNAEERGWIKPIVVNHKNDKMAAEIAVGIVRDGKADLLMKGDVSSDIILSAVLDREYGLRTGTRLSHTAVLESPVYDRLMLMTDGGVNPELDETILSSIIQNSVDIAGKLMNPNPNVAMLSLIEKINPNVPETVIMGKMAEKYRNSNSFTVEGPISIDVAISSRNAETKKIDSEIAGSTDIFIGPNITSINFMVKSLLGMGGAKGGGIITGAKVPIILLSRSDLMETKLNSIALGIVNL
ncbi:MAG: phosphate butyryltransferase [Candidatus Marinimicrobia bacterium]|jgi:phosphate butyryltransferase|nr:phosphate butyryltransferase [Candidatus Neomarinimicrobiota bacterium]MBT3634099.1 phosphate butyryltransferase [Candidatus Neomarinimicrobiota bacterium]MBT3683027.1 phosphate butyryltransferase [Candidatus Neomarinimicrobiota bacterium]MBT3759881.1 phosphate butyryltransferase [Candidatus Neomarinimicrobiota bacterium]MBT3895666.1 phosphate butyryltransferase [Candidatus Neomarinimicrobiota bacterium]